MSPSRDEVNSHSNGKAINRHATIDVARDQVAAMVMSEADNLSKTRNAAVTNNHVTEETTTSTASTSRPNNSKRKPVHQRHLSSKGIRSTSLGPSDLSNAKHNGKLIWSPEDNHSGEFDVREMLRERQFIMEDTHTNGHTTADVNHQQQDTERLTITGPSTMHRGQDAGMINEESQATAPLPVLRRNQNVRAPTRVGAIAVAPAQSFNNDGNTHQASSTLLENHDPSGMLVQATLVEDEAGLDTMSQRIQFEEETRIRLLDELVVDAGTAIIVDPTAQTRKTRRRMCALVVGALILMAIILGSVLGYASSGGATKTYVVLTQAPTTSSIPSLSPSTAPSLSHTPTAVPTNSPSNSPTDSPTNSPTDTPSSNPTTTPDNRFCTDAKVLFVGETAHEEDIWGSTGILQAPSFSPLDDFGDFGITDPSLSPLSYEDIYNTLNMVVTCEFGNAYMGPVRWYRMTGAGPVTATTCDPRTTAEAIIQGACDVC